MDAIKPNRPKPSNAGKGRAVLELTTQQIADFTLLVQSGMTAAQACAAMELSFQRSPKHYEKLALQAQTKQRLELYSSLLSHVKDNASAAVFAAKAKLGWQDITKIEQNQVVEYVDIPERESREAWQKRQALRLVKTGSSG